MSYHDAPIMHFWGSKKLRGSIPLKPLYLDTFWLQIQSKYSTQKCHSWKKLITSELYITAVFLWHMLDKFNFITWSFFLFCFRSFFWPPPQPHPIKSGPQLTCRNNIIMPLAFICVSAPSQFLCIRASIQLKAMTAPIKFDMKNHFVRLQHFVQENRMLV